MIVATATRDRPGSLEETLCSIACCGVDYEKVQPAWMELYLRGSAKGWSEGSDPCEIHAVMPLNRGASVQDIMEAGGFHACRGPGMSHMIGDESYMPSRVIRRGGRGEYLPEALVWQYVPNERWGEAG